LKVTRKLLWFLGIVLAVVIAAGIGFYERPVTFFNAFLRFQMRLAGVQSRWITVNGFRMHYYVQGPENAPPAVLVHGLGGQAEDWKNLAPYIVAGSLRVYTPDLPGFGRSERPQSFSYSVADQAATVVAFMDALGLKQVDLAGWSMGGWIAQRVALGHPDRIRLLMLFDSAGLNDQPAWNTALFTPTTAIELSQLNDLLMPHPPQVPGFIVNDILRISHGHAWVIRRSLDAMMAGHDITDAQLPTLRMPVLIVWGSADRMFPVTQAEKMHRLIPQSQLDVIDGCGHLAPAQCADKMGPKVEEFLKRPAQ